MRHTASRWIHPFRTVATTDPAIRGSLALIRPPLRTHARASTSPPPGWSWGHLIAPPSPRHHPLDEQTFASTVGANLLVKRPMLYYNSKGSTPRFRSTALLCRLRATKTLFR